MQQHGFVCREQELEDLHGHLQQALAGAGQIFFVTGQAGSGKTALVRQFLQEALATDPDLVVAMGSCNAQTGIGDPYLPFREALGVLTGDHAAQQATSKLATENSSRLSAVLVRSVQVLVEVAPELVGAFVPGVKLLGHLGKAVFTRAGWMTQLDELAKRKVGATESVAEQGRIFEQYTAFMQRFSARTPLVLFLDDLQWADSASIGLLFHLARHIDASRILIVGAYRANDVALGRNGKRHPLEPVVHELTRNYGDISNDLDAIPETASRQFVDALLDEQPNSLGEGFRQALFRQTGGHALFTVELIQAMQERGDLVRDSDGRWVEGDSLEWSALPARVEGVIAERIGRLSEELKQILMVGSVEGEQFTAEVIARVQAISEREAIRALSGELQRQHHLVGALGLIQLGGVQLSLYRFLHNLFQQYLYGIMGDAERACLHRDMGAAMEELFAGETDSVAAQLARHFEEGGMPAKAAAYRLQAGNRAHRMSADQEAAAHYSRGLELLASLPAGPDRMRLELGLQTSLGTALTATHGYAAPQVEQAFSRARELCRALGDPPQVIPVLYGLSLFRLVRAELNRSHEDGEQLLSLAQRAGNVGYIMGCQAQLGATAMYLGRLQEARELLEQVISAYDRNEHADLAYQHGQDPCVAALSYLPWVLWVQGYPEQALQRSREGLELARELEHAYSLTMAMVFSAKLHELLRLWPECQAHAEAALDAANQKGFSLWKAMGTLVHGPALAYQGRHEEGIAILTQGLARLEATGAVLSATYASARLADIYLLLGRRDDGQGALEESLSTIEQRWWLPEQYRLHAELLLLEPGAEDDAEASLRQALRVAQEQQSKSLELRAAMSLARLLRRQGRSAEGRDLLRQVYDWFSEGLDTPDLRDARELLAQLEQVTQKQISAPVVLRS
jgi:predicted ATPase